MVYDLAASDKTSNLWLNISLSFFVSFFCTNTKLENKIHNVCIDFKCRKFKTATFEKPFTSTRKLNRCLNSKVGRRKGSRRTMQKDETERAVGHLKPARA